MTELPPKERASVVLKDILDCSLEETGEITGSTVGAVKAALHRARTKLLEADGTRPMTPIEPTKRAVIERYIDAFNRRDWESVRALVTADTRLEVVHRTEGRFGESSYIVNYMAISVPWRLAFASVDGIERVVHFREIDGSWVARSIVNLQVDGDRVSVVRDYVHVDDLLRCCTWSGTHVSSVVTERAPG